MNTRIETVVQEMQNIEQEYREISRLRGLPRGLSRLTKKFSIDDIKAAIVYTFDGETGASAEKTEELCEEADNLGISVVEYRMLSSYGNTNDISAALVSTFNTEKSDFDFREAMNLCIEAKFFGAPVIEYQFLSNKYGRENIGFLAGLCYESDVNVRKFIPYLEKLKVERTMRVVKENIDDLGQALSDLERIAMKARRDSFRPIQEEKYQLMAAQ